MFCVKEGTIINIVENSRKGWPGTWNYPYSFITAQLLGTRNYLGIINGRLLSFFFLQCEINIWIWKENLQLYTVIIVSASMWRILTQYTNITAVGKMNSSIKGYVSIY